MSPSRRQFACAIGTTVALAGCNALGLGTDDNAATPNETDDQSISAAIEARVLGPETDKRLFEGSDILRVGEVTERESGFQFWLELSDSGTAAFVETFREADVSENPEDFEIQLLDGDEEFRRFGVSRGLASEIESDEWDGRFVINLEDRATAEEGRSRFLADTQETPTQ